MPSHWKMHLGEKRLVGRIKDIFVLFLHDSTMDKPIRRWNALRHYVDFNNLVAVMEEEFGNEPVTHEIASKFRELPYKHLLLMRSRMYSGLDEAIYTTHLNFHERNIMVEDWFDLLGWINS